MFSTANVLQIFQSSDIAKGYSATSFVLCVGSKVTSHNWLISLKSLKKQVHKKLEF